MMGWFIQHIFYPGLRVFVAFVFFAAVAKFLFVYTPICKKSVRNGVAYTRCLNLIESAGDDWAGVFRWRVLTKDDMKK